MFDTLNLGGTVIAHCIRGIHRATVFHMLIRYSGLGEHRDIALVAIQSNRYVELDKALEPRKFQQGRKETWSVDNRPWFHEWEQKAMQDSHLRLMPPDAALQHAATSRTTSRIGAGRHGLWNAWLNDDITDAFGPRLSKCDDSTGNSYGPCGKRLHHQREVPLPPPKPNQNPTLPENIRSVVGNAAYSYDYFDVPPGVTLEDMETELVRAAVCKEDEITRKLKPAGDHLNKFVIEFPFSSHEGQSYRMVTYGISDWSKEKKGRCWLHAYIQTSPKVIVEVKSKMKLLHKRIVENQNKQHPKSSSYKIPKPPSPPPKRSMKRGLNAYTYDAWQDNTPVDSYQRQWNRRVAGR